jgi:glycosyltransferase involved in cell wall biosynthesis
MLISIIIPTFNEEKTILNILKKISTLNCWTEYKDEKNLKKEVIIVDDGSSDNTIELLENNRYLYSKLIKSEKNYGKGHAIIAGLKHCQGDYVLFQDADDEYDPADYSKFFSCLINFNADLVIGSRFKYDRYTRSHYFLNRLGNWFITLAFNITHNCTFTDIYCCYLVFKRKLLKVENIKSLGFEQHAEILSFLVKSGKIFFEVPVNYKGRTVSEGKKIKFYHIFVIFYQIFKSTFKK